MSGERIVTLARFALFKSGTWLAWMIVRTLPIPFDRPGTIHYRAMAWLWGWAYVSDFDFATWRQLARNRSLIKEERG